LLKITGSGETAATESSDIVGRFRSGYQIDGEPASLSAFRVTTGDEAVAKKIAEKLGVDTSHGEEQPQEWEAQGEDYLEVFTKADKVVIVLDSANDYKSTLVRRTRDGDFMYATDGQVILGVGEDYEDEFTVGDPAPEAKMDLDTIKTKAKKGLAASPDIRVTFLIKGLEDLGKFQFRSGGWSLVHNDPEEKLRRLPDGPIEAELKLTTVEGKRFTWTKPELVVRKSLAEGVVKNEKPSVGEAPF
jgi:hypothetical protein